MSLFSNKPAQKDLKEMSKDEKRDFLASDLIERMVRIEQNVRGSMGEGVVPYTQTDYFKGLKPAEKKRFTEYLEKKEKRKKWRFLPFVLILSAGGFLAQRITGNVVGPGREIPAINLILLAIFLVAVIIYWIYVIAKRRRMKRLNKHFKVYENIIHKRKDNKKKKKSK